MKNKSTVINSIIILIIPLIIFIIYLSLNAQKNSLISAQTTNNKANIETVDGVQYLDLTAKGGYRPNLILAQANKATILRVTTNNTFDCSSAISIPSVNYRSNLPANGVTEISIPAQAPGTELNGTCSMGMYRFKIKFS